MATMELVAAFFDMIGGIAGTIAAIFAIWAIHKELSRDKKTED